MSRLGFLTAVVELRLAEAFIDLRDLERAGSHANKALEVVQMARVHMQQAAKAQFGRIHLLEGNLIQAQEIESDLESLAGSESMFSVSFSLPVWQVQIGLALARENTAYAVRRTEEAISLAEKFSIRIYLPVLQTLLARGLWQQGDELAARQALAAAEAVTREMGARRYLWSILAQQALWAEDEETAEKLRVSARAEVNTMLEDIGTPELRQSFLERQEIKQLMA